MKGRSICTSEKWRNQGQNIWASPRPFGFLPAPCNFPPVFMQLELAGGVGIQVWGRSHPSLRKAPDCFRTGAHLQGGSNGVFLGLHFVGSHPRLTSGFSLQLRCQTTMSSLFLISIQKPVSSERRVQGWGMGTREGQEVSHGNQPRVTQRRAICSHLETG